MCVQIIPSIFQYQIILESARVTGFTSQAQRYSPLCAMLLQNCFFKLNNLFVIFSRLKKGKQKRRLMNYIFINFFNKMFLNMNIFFASFSTTFGKNNLVGVIKLQSYTTTMSVDARWRGVTPLWSGKFGFAPLSYKRQRKVLIQ